MGAALNVPTWRRNLDIKALQNIHRRLSLISCASMSTDKLVALLPTSTRF